MALTSLESISEKLEENKKIQLEDILRVSGSSAITRNEYGITEVDENNVASSLVFKVINKPKIDPNEIKKVIDIDIVELKPNIPSIEDAVVAKSLFDDQVQTNNDLTKEVERLNGVVSNLNDEISNLKSQLDNETNNRINIEQSNDALNNQSVSLNKSIDDLSKQIQTAIQKSAEESILRASLQAQNAGFKVQIEALTKQIDSLNSIIEGLQAQIGGVIQPQIVQNTATSQNTNQQNVTVVNDVIVVSLPGTTGNTFRVAANYSGPGTNFANFTSGDKFSITNNDTNNVGFNFSLDMPTLSNANEWVSFSKNGFGMSPGLSDTVTLILNNAKIPYNPSAALSSSPKGSSVGNTPKRSSHRGNIVLKIKRITGGQAVETVRYFPIQLTIDYSPTVYV